MEFLDLWSHPGEEIRDFRDFDMLEEEGVSSTDLREERLSLKSVFEEILRKEDTSWRYKAKVSWVKEGDCNSKLFHNVANGRRNKNVSDHLVTESGDVLKEDFEIEVEVVAFLEGLDWSPISNHDMEGLEEIRKVVFGSNIDKSPSHG